MNCRNSIINTGTVMQKRTHGLLRLGMRYLRLLLKFTQLIVDIFNLEIRESVPHRDYSWLKNLVVAVARTKAAARKMFLVVLTTDPRSVAVEQGVVQRYRFEVLWLAHSPRQLR